MLTDFLPQILILIGLVGGGIVLVRRSQNLSDEELKIFASQPRPITRAKALWYIYVAERFPKEEVEQRLLLVAEKTLRRFRIALAKLDTSLSHLQMRFQELKKRQVLDPHYWTHLKKAHGGRAAASQSRLDPVEEEMKIQNAVLQDAKELVNLARLYLAKKEYADARRVLLLAWRLDPEDRAVRALLHDIHINEPKIIATAVAKER